MVRQARRSNQARRGESQERILDAAEALFARNGFNGVSVKDIAEAADVDASLLHYYFTSKAGLYSAVIGRRAGQVNAARLTALQTYAADAGGAVTVAGVVRTYVQATFDFAMTGGEGYLNYLAVIAQLNSTPAGAIPIAEATPFDDVVQVFIDLLRQASPGSTDAELYWFYHMLSGAISLSWARTGRIDRLSGGVCRSTDFEAIAAQMIAVFSRGLDGPGTPAGRRRGGV
ncbi:TetR family transcriptional regulator [Phenylobacterium sp. LjRoot225]|uniref:TetR family transcriptional regulator n=1 Tax=Phenylobacterium sp. LjRoot225 TaxID=3342285 RepID=UPI003ECECDB5